MNTNKGIFTNSLGGKHDVTILSMKENSTTFPGGGNPFTVKTVDVVMEFNGPIRRSSESTVLALTGYPRDGYIGFYGSCADSDIRQILTLEA